MTRRPQNQGTSQAPSRGRNDSTSASNGGSRGQTRQSNRPGQAGGRTQTGRTGATAQFAGQDEDAQQPWQVEHPEAQTLRLAADACNAAFAYVTQQDEVDDPELLACIVDCVDLCTTTASFIVRGSEHADDLREVCAELAKCVEESCEEYGDDEVLTACADACREAYEALNMQATPRVG